MLFVLKQKG